MQIFFEKFQHLGVAQAPYIFRGGANGLNAHISQTTCARNLFQVPKDAEYVVSYLTSIHLIGPTGLDFKLTEKNWIFTKIYQVLFLSWANDLSSKGIKDKSNSCI